MKELRGDGAENSNISKHRELKILGKFIGFIPLEFSHFSADENLDDMFL